MDLTLALAHVMAYLGLTAALAAPRLRRVGAAILGIVATFGIAVAIAGDGKRTLETVHTYAGFEGSAMEVSMVSFPTGTVTAEAWLWPLPFAGFAVLWMVILLGLGQRHAKNPWLLPILFAWTGLATWLGMQQLAAPSQLVQPVGIDRFLWPAGLALCLVAARSAKSLLMVFVMVSSGILLGRLPAALFSKYASDNALGTCLDIHTIRDIVNPMTQMQFDPRLEVGSGDQQFWLIWLEHMIFYPGVYAMSLFGISFGVYMWHKHGDKPA